MSKDAMTQTKTNILKDLIDVMGDHVHDRLVYIVIRPGTQSDASVMTVSEALAKYSYKTVRLVEPYIDSGGEYKGNMYHIDLTEPAQSGDFVKNPTKIPYDMPTWRLGDTAWVVGKEPGALPRKCRLTSASIQPGRVLASIQYEDTYDEEFNVDLNFLFKDAKSANQAAAAYRAEK